MNYYLVHRGEPLTIVLNYGRNFAKAHLAYVALESLGDDCCLFSADSVDTLRQTHGNWFEGPYLIAKPGMLKAYKDIQLGLRVDPRARVSQTHGEV